MNITEVLPVYLFIIGLHVNITEGLPVSPPHLVTSLLSPDTGAFVGKFVFRKMLADGLLSMDEVKDLHYFCDIP